MNEETLQHIARQLRQPHSEAGIQVGERMNVGNELINRRAITHLAVQSGETILETGMGNGFFVRDIVSIDPSVRYIGCDHSDVMVEQAELLNENFIQRGQAQFMVRQGQQLPFADSSFDAILTINTLYFWDNPANELAELGRVLKPDGRLLIGIRPRRIMESMPFTKYGFTLYSRDELITLLTANGFSIQQIIEESEPVQTLNGVEVAMEMLLIQASSIP